MQLIRDHAHFSTPTIVTIGNFDGVHIGHQHLIQVVIASQRVLHFSTVLITFEPHPVEFFAKKNPIARLMRFSEKWRAIEKYGIDYFYCMRFSKSLSDLSAEDFVKNILVDQLHAKKIIIGDDFRFGAKRAGDVALLNTLGKQYGFTIQVITQSTHDHDRISSTRVRNALTQGDFDTVRALTGHPFTLSGKVTYGDQRGRQLGFPTANIHLRRPAVPLMGIFVVRVHGLVSQPLSAVASVGYRPTFNGKKIILEVHIFDFDQLIYGKRISIEFIAKIRDELKFDSVNALITQIQRDVDIAKGLGFVA